MLLQSGGGDDAATGKESKVRANIAQLTAAGGHYSKVPGFKGLGDQYPSKDLETQPADSDHLAGREAAGRHFGRRLG
jgi:hypothetical protein